MIHTQEVRIGLLRLAARQRILSAQLAETAEPNRAAYRAQRADLFEAVAAEPEATQLPDKPYPYENAVQQIDPDFFCDIACGVVFFALSFLMVIGVMAL